MSKRHQLRQLLQEPQVWKMGQRGFQGYQALSTGDSGLDHALTGGWPVGVLTELLVDPCGIGEFRLLMPALSVLSNRPVQFYGQGRQSAAVHNQKWVMLVAPPYIPYAPALKDAGINLSRVLVVHCRQPNEALWTMEQALRSGTCAAVLTWSKSSDQRALRRLQLAAETGCGGEGVAGETGCLAVLFRSPRFRAQRSPAALRAQLRPGECARLSPRLSLSVEVFKNRGGRPRTILVDI
jgi:protein ImuA